MFHNCMIERLRRGSCQSMHHQYLYNVIEESERRGCCQDVWGAITHNHQSGQYTECAHQPAKQVLGNRRVYRVCVFGKAVDNPPNGCGVIEAHGCFHAIRKKSIVLEPGCTKSSNSQGQGSQVYDKTCATMKISPEQCANSVILKHRYRPLQSVPNTGG